MAISILFLVTYLSYSFAETYKWEDFSKPFMRNTEAICNHRYVKVEVLIPDYLKSYESVQLNVEIDVDEILPGRPRLIVNNYSHDPYVIDTSGDSYIAIKTKHLRAGINSLNFYNKTGNPIRVHIATDAFRDRLEHGL